MKKQKHEIIIKHEMGFSIREIANEMKINKNSVTRWLDRYNENNNVDRKKG
jgi:transposase